MTDHELLQTALDALKHLCLHSRAVQGYDGEKVQSGIDALKSRLAQPEREWVGLTDAEIIAMRHMRDWTAGWTDIRYAKAIEAKLRDKNS